MGIFGAIKNKLKEKVQQGAGYVLEHGGEKVFQKLEDSGAKYVGNEPKFVFDPYSSPSSSKYEDDNNTVTVGTREHLDLIPDKKSGVSWRVESKAIDRKLDVPSVLEHETAHWDWFQNLSVPEKKAFIKSLKDLEVAKRTGSPSLNNPENPLSRFSVNAYSDPLKNYTGKKSGVNQRITQGLDSALGGKITSQGYKESYAVLAEKFSGNRDKNPFRQYYAKMYARSPEPIPVVKDAASPKKYIEKRDENGVNYYFSHVYGKWIPL